MKKIMINILKVLIPILGISMILCILNYIGLLNYKVLDIFKYIIVFISVFIGSLYYGIFNKKKGIQNGIKLGLLIIVVLSLFNFVIFLNKFSIKSLIYYTLILIVSIVGNILGVNKKSSRS